jgi:hypothetical protein
VGIWYYEDILIKRGDVISQHYHWASTAPPGNLDQMSMVDWHLTRYNMSVKPAVVRESFRGLGECKTLHYVVLGIK